MFDIFSRPRSLRELLGPPPAPLEWTVERQPKPVTVLLKKSKAGITYSFSPGVHPDEVAVLPKEGAMTVKVTSRSYSEEEQYALQTSSLTLADEKLAFAGHTAPEVKEGRVSIFVPWLKS